MLKTCGESNDVGKKAERGEKIDLRNFGNFGIEVEAYVYCIKQHVTFPKLGLA